MKKIIILFSVLFSVNVAFAQTEETGLIAIKALQPAGQNVPEEARSLLESKMQKLILARGMAENNVSDRFVMTAKVTVLQKDVTPTTPAKISQKLEITFFVVDAIDKVIFSSSSLTVAGIGDNETKAFLQAFQRINTNNPQLQSFVDVAKQRIADYYTQKCETILKEAAVLENNQEYDAAIAKLVAVPKSCAACYAKSSDAAIAVYNKKINTEGKQLIQQAKSAWIVSQDSTGAANAFTFLTQINPQASCTDDAETLWLEISEKLNQQREEKKQFEKQQFEENQQFQKQQYADELSFKKQQYKDEVRLREMNIKATERIGVAYGENQPRVKTTNFGWLW